MKGDLVATLVRCLVSAGAAWAAWAKTGKMRWSRNKYKRLRSRKKAQAQWERVVKFFAH
jgi:hypothetical protein